MREYSKDKIFDNYFLKISHESLKSEFRFLYEVFAIYSIMILIGVHPHFKKLAKQGCVKLNFSKLGVFTLINIFLSFFMVLHELTNYFIVQTDNFKIA